MRRAVLLIPAVFLICVVAAQAEDGRGLKGRFFLGGYGGYTIGMGDPWGDQSASVDTSGFTAETDASLDPTISAGGMFHYGVSERFMLGGEVTIQVYDKKEVGTIAGIPYDASEDETRANFLVNCLYALNYVDGEGGFFVSFGGGIYGGLGGVLDLQKAIDEALQGNPPDYDGTAFGVNAGFMYTRTVAESLNLFVMPRFHLVFSDPTAKMIQVVGGIQIPFGN